MSRDPNSDRAAAPDPDTNRTGTGPAVNTTDLVYALQRSNADSPETRRYLERLTQIAWRLTSRANAQGARNGVWTVSESKRHFREILDSSAQTAQVIVDARNRARPASVLISETDAMGLLKLLNRLAEPRYATGRDLVAELGRDGPPASVATRPRRKVFQPRRRVAEARVDETRLAAASAKPKSGGRSRT